MADKRDALATIDRRVLIGNLVSGGLWLLVPAVLGAWMLLVVGAVYVAVAGTFLAAAHGRGSVRVRQELLAWAVPWLVAIAIWVWIGFNVDGGGSGSSDVLLNLWLGLVLGTGCYLAWQLSALVVRRVLIRNGTARGHQG